MKLIVGLGNPDGRFRYSRHNVGFACVDYIGRKWDVKLSERRSKAVMGEGEVAGTPVVLAKPRTYMNNSGEGVLYILARYSAVPEDLVIVYDDMDLPLGRIRIRPRGGAAGHNGIRSIISALSTQEFPRVRVGIGKPDVSLEGAEHVLGFFSPEERPVIRRTVERVGEAVVCILEGGVQQAMNRFNLVS